MVSHAELPPKLGYSFTDETSKAAWRALVSSINARIAETDIEDEVLFHGTSSVALERIIAVGFEPTDISHAVADGDIHRDGSFWGDLMTAAAYAEDTVAERHPGSTPVILAIPVAALEADCQLFSDGATFDFPLDGLTRLDDPDVLARWSESGCDLPWRESLADLGAVVAAHQFVIPAEDIVVMNSPDDLHSMVMAAGGGNLAEPRF